MLTGKPNDKITQRRHDALSVYGIVEGDEAALIKPVSRALMVRGALDTNEHGGLMLGPAAKAILRGEEELALVLPPVRARRSRRGGAEANPVGDPLFEALRELRRTLAKEAGVPPYVIFHDSTLRELAAQRPRRDEELAHIGGIGSRKREAYGPAFLDLIAGFEQA